MGNPMMVDVLNKDGEDEDEDNNSKAAKATILSFLQTFNRIHCLGYWNYDPDIEYALRMNRARQALLLGGGSSSRSRIPLLVWPTVLEWAYEKSADIYRYGMGEKSTTELYHLLRDGPALIGRPGLGGGNDVSSVSGDSKNKNSTIRRSTRKRTVTGESSIAVLSTDTTNTDRQPLMKRPRQDV